MTPAEASPALTPEAAQAPGPEPLDAGPAGRDRGNERQRGADLGPCGQRCSGERTFSPRRSRGNSTGACSTGPWRDAGRYRTGERNPRVGAAPDRRGREAVPRRRRRMAAVLNVSRPRGAVRLHHRLVAIHPWESGNGRHARLIADVLVASHGEEPLTWGLRGGKGAASPRSRYLEANRARTRATSRRCLNSPGVRRSRTRSRRSRGASRTGRR